MLLGGLLVYLFGILGFQIASHGHDSKQSHPQSHTQSHGQSHPDCQLCQITAQTYLAPAPLVCAENPAVPVRLVEAVWAPILAERFQPFSSRAPPAA